MIITTEIFFIKTKLGRIKTKTGGKRNNYCCFQKNTIFEENILAYQNRLSALTFLRGVCRRQTSALKVYKQTGQNTN